MLQFNFVGRILGPRGMTAKQLEQETGCKIMVRGRGSMRDKKKVSHSETFIYIIIYTIDNKHVDFEIISMRNREENK
jgi:rRNA processing protein Krr1/Pno1